MPAKQPAGTEREAQRKEIEAEIAQAKKLLNQPEIDGEESRYSEETLNRAIAFLRTHVEWAWRERGAKVPIPTIGPGPRGSVDLYWEQPSWKLLVNMPSDKDASATFYGDDYSRQTKGSADPNKLSITIMTALLPRRNPDALP